MVGREAAMETRKKLVREAGPLSGLCPGFGDYVWISKAFKLKYTCRPWGLLRQGVCPVRSNPLGYDGYRRHSVGWARICKPIVTTTFQYATKPQANCHFTLQSS
jgi:hypothetical protein